MSTGQTAKTFAEVRYEAPFDWNAFLAQPEHTEAEWSHAFRLAGDWVTCACGNQCAVLPREDDGEPLDTVLSDLGQDFYMSIAWEDAEGAKRILADIELRTAYLLALPGYREI
jgi:hypothetical protein